MICEKILGKLTDGVFSGKKVDYVDIHWDEAFKKLHRKTSQGGTELGIRLDDSVLTRGLLLIIRIPLLTILRLSIAVLRRVALTIGIIGRVAAIRGIALRRRIIALRKTGLLRILSGVPGAIIGWTAVAHPASFPFFRAIVREVPCRACGRRNCTLPRADFHASACFALYMITHLTV